MSLLRFDEALVKKLKNVFPNVQNVQEDKVGSEGTDDNAELRVPLITVWRLSNTLNFGQFSNDGMIRRGFSYQSDDGMLVVKALPVKISYQIDIISDKRTEVDDIFRELAMFLYEKDSLDVEFDMGPNEEPLNREFTIQLIDNSTSTDYGSFDDRGKLYRETINVEISNAELIFTNKAPRVENIPCRIYVNSTGVDVEV